MKRRLGAVVAAALLPLAATTVMLTGRSAEAAATLTKVTNFGSNPTNLAMYVYTPKTMATKPAMLVLVHFCQGSASAVAGGDGRDFMSGADKYGYLVVLPESTRSGKCFDVSTSQALKRNGGGDSTGIMSMVSWARQKYNADSSRIAVAGFSSGAMMTNVLAAEYPDVFKAAAAFAGVPAGCFATTGGSLWNSDCANGRITKTAQQWGDAARAMYSGYSGSYPRMQLFHGTADTTLNYKNFGEEIKEWTNLKKVSQTASFTDHPKTNWTRTRYGSTGSKAPVEAYSIAGAGHGLPSGVVAYAIPFLGLDGSN